MIKRLSEKFLNRRGVAMRWGLLALMLAFCGLLTIKTEATPAPKGLIPPEDRKLIEGWWEVVTMDDGRGPTPHRDKDLIRDGRLFHTGTLRNEEPGHPIRLDPAKSPKEFDVEWSSGKFYHGIYRLNGDNLIVCYGNPGKPRPTEFAGSDGTTYCIFYRRVAEDRTEK
jgi:uncharacterized protein (TIGR03067 family)